MSPSSFPDHTTIKHRVNKALTLFFDERTHEAQTIHASYAQLWETAATLVAAGGKRFRPYMTLLSYWMYLPDAKLKAIMPAALAQELVHSALLMHDDIIDRDLVRYGVPNVAGHYKEHRYRAHLTDEAERHHFASSAALLAGDVFVSEAYQLLQRVDASPKRIAQATAILATGIFEVIGGELLDGEVAFMPEGFISAETVARYKTASYSFISPLSMGAVLAGAPPSDVKALTTLAEHIGIGYQLRDDLLGIFGDEETTGKSTTGDIREGKRTYLIEQFDALATPEQKETFYAIFHHPEATAAEIKKAKHLLEKSGAVEAVETAIEAREWEALQRLHDLHISADAHHELKQFIRRCLTRNY
ncbi:MAG TPA: polyprenyl synthetase family protein [Dongiaceae bacterium]|nr:polyprenyl synthetase family protein [Dongiaceae bacterium]